MVVVRAEEAGDASKIANVLSKAFARLGYDTPPEVGLVAQLRDSDAWLPNLSIVAVVAGVIVAHALLSRVWVGRSPALVLGPVAVLPAHQNQGVGTHVVNAALVAADRAGERLVVVLGDPAFYSRFGFVPASRFGVLGPWKVPDDVYQALPLSKYGDGDDLVGAVEYPEPFYEV